MRTLLALRGMSWPDLRAKVRYFCRLRPASPSRPRRSMFFYACYPPSINPHMASWDKLNLDYLLGTL